MSVRSQIPKWMWATLVGAGTITALMLSMFKVWDAIDTRLQSSITTATVLITQEIRTQTETIAEYYEDDLYERINMLEAEILSLNNANLPVPERKLIYLRSMKERLGEFKNR